jgi:hypothetical protein
MLFNEKYQNIPVDGSSIFLFHMISPQGLPVRNSPSKSTTSSATFSWNLFLLARESKNKKNCPLR